MAMPLLAHSGVPQDAGAKAPASLASPDLLALGTSSNRMTVPVLVADMGPFPFIVDTGAERSIVSHELATQLRLLPGANARLFDFAGVSAVTTARVSSLTAGSLVTPALDAPLLDMANIGAAGMLGIDALQGRKIVLDFERRQMLLLPSKRHAGGDVRIKAERRLGQLIVTRALFEDQPIAVVIDTGSSISVGNSAMKALIKRRPRSYGKVEVTSVTGRIFEADYVSVNNVRIGDVRFDNFPLAFADVPPFARFGLKDRPALILGFNSLKLFRRVEIDFANREVAFSLRNPRYDFADTCRGMSNCKSF